MKDNNLSMSTNQYLNYLTVADLIPEKERIHVESKNPLNKIFRGKRPSLLYGSSSLNSSLLIPYSSAESSIHNNIMHDCNRHRENGYRDKTWDQRIKDEMIEEYSRMRHKDTNRKQNILHSRFPSLAEAKDQYISSETDMMTPFQ